TKIASDESMQRSFDGPALQSAQRYYWHVRVWDEQGKASPWSEVAYWEMALLNVSDWKTNWIDPDLTQDTSKSQPPSLLRGSFNVNGPVRQARAYVTSHGLYELHLNGQRVGDQVFTPGWTSYNKRLQYQTYDVTSLLRSGATALGPILGDGWDRGFLAWGGRRNHYGEKLGLLLQLKVTYKDGHEEVIATDQNW